LTLLVFNSKLVLVTAVNGIEGGVNDAVYNAVPLTILKLDIIAGALPPDPGPMFLVAGAPL
jgi:hypothetical protein